MIEGDVYKFAVKDQSGYIHEKADPYAFYAELRPKTGSRIWNIEKYQWKDKKWMKKRAESQNLAKPMSIYKSIWLHGCMCRKRGTGL